MTQKTFTNNLQTIYNKLIKTTPHNTKCKGCNNTLNPDQIRNALSRYKHGYICSDCGTKEAFVGDFINKTSL